MVRPSASSSAICNSRGVSRSTVTGGPAPRGRAGGGQLLGRPFRPGGGTQLFERVERGPEQRAPPPDDGRGGAGCRRSAGCELSRTGPASARATAARSETSGQARRPDRPGRRPDRPGRGPTADPCVRPVSQRVVGGDLPGGRHLPQSQQGLHPIGAGRQFDAGDAGGGQPLVDLGVLSGGGPARPRLSSRSPIARPAHARPIRMPRSAQIR